MKIRGKKLGKTIIRFLMFGFLLSMMFGKVSLAKGEQEYVLPEDELTGYGVLLESDEQNSHSGLSPLLDTVPSEAEAYKGMIGLKKEFPEGMRYTNDDYYAWKGGIFTGGYGCAGFAFRMSDEVFGSLPSRRIYSFTYDDVHVGDILRVNNDTHSVIVIERYEDYVVVAEGNYNSSIHWGRVFTKENVLKATYLHTRYPEGTFNNKIAKIVYHANGGDESTVPGTQLSEIGKSICLSSRIPSKPFHKFLGWNLSDAATSGRYQPGEAFKTASSTVNLYAVWESSCDTLPDNAPNRVTVSIDQPGQKLYYCFVPSYSARYTFSSISQFDTKIEFYDQNFSLYASDDDSGTDFNFSMPVDLVAGQKYYMVIYLYSTSSTGEFDLDISIPSSAIKKYTVTFDANNGTCDITSALYRQGTELAALPTASRTGFKFNGWYTEKSGGTKISAATICKSDMILYAHWTSIKYNIQFVGNGAENGTMAALSDCKYTVSYTLTKNEFAKKGYSFNGWNTKADGSGTSYKEGATVKNLSSKEGTTVKLYAQWKPKMYNIVFDGNGATSGSMEGLTKLAYDSQYTLPANAFKKTNYLFIGWNTKADGTGTALENKSVYSNLSASSNGTVTLYAQWKKDSYTITYVLNGGKNSSSNPVEYTRTTADIILQAPTKTGYSFKGWYKESTFVTQVTSIPKGSTGNLKLYAQWNAKKYNIAFNGNGATGGAMASIQKVAYGDTIQLPAIAFKKTGYKFVSWNTKADGNGTSYKDLASVKNLSASSGATVTLYAIWAPKTYNISFNGNGATSGTMETISKVSYDSRYTLPANTFKKTGKTFAGWNTRADGSGTSYANKATVSNLSASSGATITLYAVWK